MTILDQDTRTVTSDIDGEERDRMSHYARKEEILRGQVEGVAITALCGKKWIPTRDPENYPVCPTCKEIYEQLENDVL